MIIDEQEMLSNLDNCKTAFLLEPNYKRKYIPLGLAKISSYIKGRGGEVIFGREYQGEDVDAVFVTSLFTYDSRKVINAINSVDFLNPGIPIIVGGVYASLMPHHLIRNAHAEIKIFRGYSQILDLCIPDYSLDYGIDSKWADYSFTFTSRGCPNNCAYCAVWRLEPLPWINPRWRECVTTSKKYAMISDNNLSAQPKRHIEGVIKHLVDNNLYAVFDNGFDCKYIDNDFAKMISAVRFPRTGLRLAFDRIEEDGIFQDAVNRLLSAGIKPISIMAYILFNFQDYPKDAYYRFKTCIDLGIQAYPQMFMPLNSIDRERTHIGKHWTKNLAVAFRQYGLFHGIHRRMGFEEYMKTRNMSSEDLDAWNSKP